MIPLVGAAAEDQIFAYLSRRAGTPENLERHLDLSTEELQRALDAMEAEGWINPGIAAWFGDPASAITVMTLTPAGREEAKRREETATEWSEEPVVLTRDELAAELQRRYRWTDEQIALESTLRYERFHFWPSIGAYTGLQD
jgi:DNA-binding MarR family transcriptional regulator